MAGSSPTTWTSSRSPSAVVAVSAARLPTTWLLVKPYPSGGHQEARSRSASAALAGRQTDDRRRHGLDDADHGLGIGVQHLRVGMVVLPLSASRAGTSFRRRRAGLHELEKRLVVSDRKRHEPLPLLRNRREILPAEGRRASPIADRDHFGGSGSSRQSLSSCSRESRGTASARGKRKEACLAQGEPAKGPSSPRHSVHELTVDRDDLDLRRRNQGPREVCKSLGREPDEPAEAVEGYGRYDGVRRACPLIRAAWVETGAFL